LSNGWEKVKHEEEAIIEFLVADSDSSKVLRLAILKTSLRKKKRNNNNKNNSSSSNKPQ